MDMHDLASYFTASNEDFGEILFNELLSINNEALATGKDVKLLSDIPSFAILNGNPHVSGAFASFVNGFERGFGDPAHRRLDSRLLTDRHQSVGARPRPYYFFVFGLSVRIRCFPKRIRDK